VTCWSCEGFDPQRRCGVCAGRTTIPMYRCPGRCRAPEVLDALRAFRWMKRGVLPIPGGYLDQSRTFLQVMECIERIEAFHNRSRDET
jgi:hypothetical protein